MNTDKIVIIGGGIMQIPLIQQAKKMAEVYVVDGDPKCLGMSYADKSIIADISDEEKVMHEIKKVIPRNLGGVITVGTDYSRTVSRVGEYYGVPVLPYKLAQILTDKSLMREKLTIAGLPQPQFQIVDNEKSFIQAINDFAQNHLAVVIKPVDSMGARGVKKLSFHSGTKQDRFTVFSPECISEFLNDFNQAMSFSRKKKIIVEEVITGKEYSLDALLHAGEVQVTGIADRMIDYPPYFIETGHVIPSQAGKETTQKLAEGFVKAIRVLVDIDPGALHISGAFKGDVFINDDGQVIIGEMAGRLSGGYMSSYTYPLSSGVNLMEAAITLSLGGNPLPLKEKSLGVVIERAVISNPGRVIEIKHEQEAKSCPGVKKIFIHVKKGEKISRPENNLMKSANVIVRGKDYMEAESYLTQTLQVLQVITR